MFLTFLFLIGSAAVIYLACEGFVNGVEWAGHRLSIGETATGTILAAFGTALPESIVTLVATAFGRTDAARELGVGAALGGPLALATIAYGVVGLALVANRRRLKRAADPVVEADGKRLSRDQLWFLGIFVVKIGLGLIAFAWKSWLGILFLAVYGFYVWTELRGEAEADEGEREPLKLRPHDPDPALGWALLQTGIALVVIFFASRFFVAQLGDVGPQLGLSPQLTALLLSPIATELPETMNALIWVRQGKERLALANISGAMMIQATVPTALGLFFTPWLLGPELRIAAAVTTIAILWLFWMFRRGAVGGRRLSKVGWLYGVFAVAILAVNL
ncbi:MAG TPA: sodium:calcium antiporter [Allosphingosinicella sp.]|jgi:cation:H+ antiporter|nr:sodium:calcium antiporter [Allosphingosinicella sp.]